MKHGGTIRRFFNRLFCAVTAPTVMRPLSERRGCVMSSFLFVVTFFLLAFPPTQIFLSCTDRLGFVSFCLLFFGVFLFSVFSSFGEQVGKGEKSSRRKGAGRKKQETVRGQDRISPGRCNVGGRCCKRRGAVYHVCGAELLQHVYIGRVYWYSSTALFVTDYTWLVFVWVCCNWDVSSSCKI